MLIIKQHHLVCYNIMHSHGWCILAADVSRTCCLTPALTAIIIGHWAQDGKVHLDSHASGTHHNAVQYGSMKILLKVIVSILTLDGQN